MNRDKPDRNQRLADALRANLRRRKGQAREWSAADTAPDPQAASRPAPDEPR